MALKICELVSLVLAAWVTGMFVGPWLALTRSIHTFEPEVFLAIVRRLNDNMASVMTALMPAGLLSIAALLFVSFGARPDIFYPALAALALFVVALLVTAIIEVPIVKRIVTWTVPTLPKDWQRLRDRWSAFHIVRIAAAVAGFILLAAGAIWR
ncbi:MAG: DUF1772 domain-containing protein [Rhizomicrobium sp.]|jgi:hypothetical protein